MCIAWLPVAAWSLAHPLPPRPLQLAALRLMPETGKRVMKKVLYESRDKALRKAAAADGAAKPAPAGVGVSAVSGSAAAGARRRKQGGAVGCGDGLYTFALVRC